MLNPGGTVFTYFSAVCFSYGVAYGCGYPSKVTGHSAFVYTG